MKKTQAFFVLFIALQSAAQEVNVMDTLIRFGLTAKGHSTGLLSENKIDQTGGSIQSSDGKIELIIPAGALAKKTNITIQPVSGMAPNGGSRAYKMEPSGIRFQQPVQLIFHYRDGDVEGSTTDLMGLAVQDDKGVWSAVDKVAVDTVLKTLSTNITHFSVYVNYAKSKIHPASARVKVNGSIRLTITHIQSTDGDDSEITSLGGATTDVSVKWLVNSIEKGNDVVGRISASQNYSAIYKAPAEVPDQNPVAVSVAFGSRGNRYNNNRLVSNILVYGDAWEVKMTANLKGGSPEAWGGYVTYNDEGSFILSMEKKEPAIRAVNNQLEDFINNCSKTILNPTTCTGMLHVAGAKKIKVTPANPPSQPYPIVEIFFKEYPIELTRFQFTCPPPPGSKESVSGAINMSQLPMQMFYGRPAIPQYLKFVAKEGEQVISEMGSLGSALYYKIWVTKVQ